MPVKPVGVVPSKLPVADYPEPKVETHRRLEAKNCYQKALRHYKAGLKKTTKGGAPVNPWLQGEPEAKTEAKWQWIRTHWPPENLAEVMGAEPVIEPIALTTPELSRQDGSTGDVEPPEPEDDENELALGDEHKRTKPRDANPVDNSIAIPGYEDRAVTVDEMLRAARWALHNALHVKARRKSLRDAPLEIASMAWSYVNWALDDFKGFNLFVQDKLEKNLAKQAEIKQRRYDDDREVSRVLDRLAEAESRAGVRLLPSRPEDAAREPCLSSPAD